MSYPYANAPRMRVVTADQVRSWRPCWLDEEGGEERLDAMLAAFPHGATARDVLTRLRGDVSDDGAIDARGNMDRDCYDRGHDPDTCRVKDAW